MKKFLFIIPQSPKKNISPLRQKLIDISLASLKNQSSNDWEALLLGEEERSEGNFHFIRSLQRSKEEKLHFAVDLLLAESQLPEYIIRFDDDDLIHPHALEKAAQLDFDCYADSWHTFYDISSGMVSAQQRPWLPNTIIHKTEHALAVYGEYHAGVHSGKRRPHLLQNDHSQSWHTYYSGKKIVYAEKENPLYVRILSPTSITAGAEQEQYISYLSRFGDWKTPAPAAFSPNFEALKEAWVSLNGPLRTYKIPSPKSLRKRLGRLFGR